MEAVVSIHFSKQFFNSRQLKCFQQPFAKKVECSTNRVHCPLMFTGLQHFQNFPTQGTRSFKSLLICIAASQQRVIGLCCCQTTTSFIFWSPFFKKWWASLHQASEVLCLYHLAIRVSVGMGFEPIVCCCFTA